MLVEMRSLTIFFALSATLTLVSSQAIVPTTSSSTFPGCALSCGVLLNAQVACIPPYAAVTSQLAYDNCFCQYSSLQALYTTPDSVCVGNCAIESDRQLLRTWFLNFCQSVAKGVDPIAGTTTITPTVTTTVTGGRATGSVITLSPVPTSNSGSSDSGPSWFSTHWKWVVMLIVLLIGLIAIAIIGVWLKRRYKRKNEEKIARISGFPMTENKGAGPKIAGATPELWGPHQHMAASLGYQYPRGEASATDTIPGGKKSKSKSKRGEITVDEAGNEDSIRPALPKGTRPRPSELDTDLRAAEDRRRRSEKKRAREKSRNRDRIVEKGLQGLPKDAE